MRKKQKSVYMKVKPNSKKILSQVKDVALVETIFEIEDMNGHDKESIAINEYKYPVKRQYPIGLIISIIIILMMVTAIFIITNSN
jgi:uncharacterized membrane protein YukC